MLRRSSQKKVPFNHAVYTRRKFQPGSNKKLPASAIYSEMAGRYFSFFNDGLFKLQQFEHILQSRSEDVIHDGFIGFVKAARHAVAVDFARFRRIQNRMRLDGCFFTLRQIAGWTNEKASIQLACPDFRPCLAAASVTIRFHPPRIPGHFHTRRTLISSFRRALAGRLPPCRSERAGA